MRAWVNQSFLNIAKSVAIDPWKSLCIFSPDATFGFFLSKIWNGNCHPSRSHWCLSSVGLLNCSFLEGCYSPSVLWVSLLVKPAAACIGSLPWNDCPCSEAGWKSAFVCLCELSFVLSHLADMGELIWKLQTVFPTQMKSEEIRLKRAFYFCMLVFWVCFWMAHPSHMGNENIMEWHISNL